MKELALHILDVAENGIRAGCSTLDISVIEDVEGDRIDIEIIDNGEGMDVKTLQCALSPFFTTKEVRSVGMGLSMLRQAAESTGGNMRVESTPGEGTAVRAEFVRSHIDRQPLGDMASTVTSILLGSPHIDIRYRHRINDDEFLFDTREIRAVMEDVSLIDPEVMRFISTMIRERSNLK